MFHVKHGSEGIEVTSSVFHVEPVDVISQLSSELGFELAGGQLDRLMRFLDWLRSEGMPAGGLGPNEGAALVDRHLVDSLTFLVPMARPPESLLDVGSGVGLPGIPLAIALPDTEIRLVDRSGRRCRLLRRVIRVLDLHNTVVQQADIGQIDDRFEVVVSRAALPPEDLLPHLLRLTGRVAIVGGSTTSAPQVGGYESVKIESRSLDSARWLLIMRPS